MRTSSHSFLLLATLAAMAAPAAAQPLDSPFTGFRLEALAGYDNVQSGNDNSSEAAQGLAYGAAAGFDAQLGRVIVGGEAEYTGSNGNLTARDVDIAGDNLALDAGRDLYVGARAGVAVTPSTLLYVKGGYTNFKVTSRYNDTVNGILERGVTLDGFRVGAGVEQQFNLLGPSGYVKAEYRYSHYSNLDFADVDGGIDTDRHQIMAGLGVRF